MIQFHNERHLEVLQLQFDSGIFDGVKVDTTQLQFLVLEKYLNYMGIFYSKGFFYDVRNNFNIVSLDRAVRMYNRGVLKLVDTLVERGIDPGVFLEKVKIQGRSVKRGFKVLEHYVKFITE